MTANSSITASAMPAGTSQITCQSCATGDDVFQHVAQPRAEELSLERPAGVLQI